MFDSLYSMPTKHRASSLDLSLLRLTHLTTVSTILQVNYDTLIELVTYVPADNKSGCPGDEQLVWNCTK